MPSSSLWLVPPENSDLYKAIYSLINTDIPSVYPDALPPTFPPHITLTADIPSAGQTEETQAWLDNIDLPQGTVSKLKVTIQNLAVAGIYFQKLTMRCQKSEELCDLAMHCREAGVDGVDVQGAKRWVEESYSPHCSLMYSDLAEEDVHSKLDEVKEKVREAKQRYADSKTAKGGSIWLVQTFKAIDEWKPVATRQLPDVEWEWQT